MPPKVLPPFWVEMAGVSNCNGTYRIDRIQSDVTVVEYIVRGSGVLYVDGRQYNPSAGDVYILPFRSDHSYISDAADPWVKIFFNLQGEAVSHMLKGFGLQHTVLFHDCEKMYPLFEKFFDVTKENVSTNEIMEECCTIFNRLLIRLHDHIYDTEDNYEAEARLIKEYIDNNCQRNLNIDMIARSVYRSNDYVNKMFRRNYGITPYVYYLETRMANAQAMLQHTNLSIKEISERLGYSDSHYFSKQFRKITGMKATEYRRMSSLQVENPKLQRKR